MGVAILRFLWATELPEHQSLCLQWSYWWEWSVCWSNNVLVIARHHGLGRFNSGRFVCVSYRHTKQLSKESPVCKIFAVCSCCRAAQATCCECRRVVVSGSDTLDFFQSNRGSIAYRDNKR